MQNGVSNFIVNWNWMMIQPTWKPDSTLELDVPNWNWRGPNELRLDIARNVPVDQLIRGKCAVRKVTAWMHWLDFHGQITWCVQTWRDMGKGMERVRIKKNARNCISTLWNSAEFGMWKLEKKYLKFGGIFCLGTRITWSSCSGWSAFDWHEKIEKVCRYLGIKMDSNSWFL